MAYDLVIKNGTVVPMPVRRPESFKQGDQVVLSQLARQRLTHWPHDIQGEVVAHLGGGVYTVFWHGHELRAHSFNELDPAEPAPVQQPGPVGPETVGQPGGPARAGNVVSLQAHRQGKLGKAEGQQWQGRPILQSSHAHDLDTQAAIYEFKHGLSRQDAEARAHDEYRLQTHTQAAAHHLRGVRAAQALGDQKAARKHGLLYNLHIRALGADPLGSVPDAVHRLTLDVERPNPGYRFQVHAGDRFVLKPTI